jgi:hypothetical protein
MVEFEELCGALERNDPNVTSVSTAALIRENPEPDDDFEDFARRLSTAIDGNTVVSHFDLDLSFILDSSDDDSVSGAAAPLMDWIQKSPALRSVRLLRTMILQFANLNDRALASCPEAVVRSVLRAMALNPHIRELRSDLYDFPWPLLADYLTRNKMLETLWLDGSQVANEARDLEATARAIESLTALGELSLPAEEAFVAVSLDLAQTPVGIQSS